jgi:hypothetical protein
MGLIRGVARTAVVAGTATAVSNRVSRRQAGRWAEQEQQAYGQQTYAPQAYAPQAYASQQEYPQETYVPPSTARQQASVSSADLAQLKELAELRSQGVLTEAEFQTQKARLLNG